MRVGVQHLARRRRPQIVDAQIDGAQFGKTLQALGRRLVHVPRPDGGHAGQAAHGIQTGTDHAAVNSVVAVMPDQLLAHVDATFDIGGLEFGDLQAQHLVENNFFFKDAFQALQKFRLKFNGKRVFGSHGVRRKRDKA